VHGGGAARWAINLPRFVLCILGPLGGRPWPKQYAVSRGGAFVISGVSSVAVLVRDAKRSAAWYRDKLDFEIVGDVGHTVFVKPKGEGATLLHLCGRCDSWEGDTPGGRTGIWLSCGAIRVRRDPKTGQVLPSSDPQAVEETYRRLKENGVEFSEQLTTVDWGKYAILKDPDGNEFEIS
jgi:catechol 2,3-dioxygenase-like lactoylglutathione lyase family enzyme